MSENDPQPFDFGSIENYLEQQEQGREVEILLPGTGRPTGLKITVCGPDSERVKRAVRWGQDQLTNRENLTDEAREEINREVSARCCTGWTGARRNGQDEAFTGEALKTWMRQWPFIQAQVNGGTGNAGRFISA